MTPSVEGAERVKVGVLLAGAASATGALAGFTAGTAWAIAHLPRLPAVALAALVAVAAGADIVHRRGWGPPPPSVRRQVPREWSRLFSPRTVAALYGARLGVGPLTILVTWLWWAAIVGAASLGPWPATLAGAGFGLARTGVGLAVAPRRTAEAAPRAASLRRREPLAFALLTGAIVLGCAVLA